MQSSTNYERRRAEKALRKYDEDYNHPNTKNRQKRARKRSTKAMTQREVVEDGI